MKRAAKLPSSGGLFPEWMTQALDREKHGPLAGLPETIKTMHREHPSLPGPVRSTCKDCRYLERHQAGGKWMKCGQFPRTTGGKATDWRAGWPACGLFEPGPGPTVGHG